MRQEKNSSVVFCVYFGHKNTRRTGGADVTGVFETPAIEKTRREPVKAC